MNRPKRAAGGTRSAPRTRESRLAKEAIASVLSFHGIADRVRAERVITEWSELVGPKIAARTRPDGIHERQLVIEVATSAWMQELNLLRPQILMGLVDRLGSPRLFDELRFRLAGRSRGVPPPRPPRPRPPAASPAPPVAAATGAAREQIARDVERVDDHELRELIARVRIENNR